jgi:hypothetical protein
MEGLRVKKSNIVKAKSDDKSDIPILYQNMDSIYTVEENPFIITQETYIGEDYPCDEGCIWTKEFAREFLDRMKTDPTPGSIGGHKGAGLQGHNGERLDADMYWFGGDIQSNGTVMRTIGYVKKAKVQDIEADLALGQLQTSLVACVQSKKTYPE